MKVEKPRCRLRPMRVTPLLPQLRRRISGRTITAVVTCSSENSVVVRLDNDDSLSFRATNGGNRPRGRSELSGAFAPFAWYWAGTAEPRQILFWDRRGLGSVCLLTPAAFAAALGPARVGPDALVTQVDEFRHRLAGSRREIKVALLDQAQRGRRRESVRRRDAVAGRHSPTEALSPADGGRLGGALHAAMRRVLKSAIRYEGSTLADGTYP